MPSLTRGQRPLQVDGRPAPGPDTASLADPAEAWRRGYFAAKRGREVAPPPSWGPRRAQAFLAGAAAAREEVPLG